MKVSNYFNPFKNDFAISKYKELTTSQKVQTIALTVIATLASLPILGLGGVAAFRWATRHFTAVNLDKKLAAPLQGEEKVNQDKFNEWLKGVFPNCTVHPSGQDVPFKYEKDTLFNVLAQHVGKSQEEVIQDLKNFIEAHPDKLETLLEGQPLLTQKAIKKWICSEHVARDYIMKYGELLMAPFQMTLNKVRLSLFSELYSLQIYAPEICAPENPTAGLFPMWTGATYGDETLQNQISLTHAMRFVFIPGNNEYIQPRSVTANSQ